MKYPRRILLGLAAAALILACNDSNSPGGQGQVQLSIATRVAAPASAQGLSLAPVTFTDGVNTLEITQVEIVVKALELEGASVGDCESGDDGEAESGGDEDDGAEEGGCEEIEVESFLLDLPLDAGATPVITISASPGTYDELALEVHPPTQADDGTFLALHPDFEGVSIRVTGSFNGTPFVYETNLEAGQESELNPPLVVDEGGMASVTLFIDIGTWFRAGDSSLIDPASANSGQPNEALVEQHIGSSFGAFGDDDHDGVEDDGEDDD